MGKVSRRNMLKLASATATAAALSPASVAQLAGKRRDSVPVWECFEVSLDGPADGNPFTEIQLDATFTLDHREVRVNGFYDGEGKYRIRFMPDTLGVWRYHTTSNHRSLDGLAGEFQATAALPGSHGPVGVCNTFHFAHADGTQFFPFGTTCYAWIHQSEQLQEQTLATLKTAPFNKLRMCVFPKHYEYNHNEPPFYPFVRDANGNNDLTRFNPAFFAHLEQRVANLRSIGVQADLILFHPYDRWGYASMPPEADDRYLRYIIARLAAYPNIWWSMANEYDLMKSKTVQDFDRFFRILEQYDPYRHLRSVHYSHTMYDYSRAWVTHASLQTSDFAAAPGFRTAWKKPVCYDEVQYEGNLNSRWGNLSGDEMARRFWLGVINGCYVTHGETYLAGPSNFDVNSTPTLWWSHGGALHGSSPQQIAFLRKLLEDAMPSGTRVGLQPPDNPYYLNASTVDAKTGQAQTILYYLDYHQPVWYDFPLPEGTFSAELIDPQQGTFKPVNGRFSGKSKLELTVRPYQAIRFRRI
jgi:hypothetical protein